MNLWVNDSHEYNSSDGMFMSLKHLHSYEEKIIME